MRDPYNPARCHAVCRRLVATSTQLTPWYGAHYWAACAQLSSPDFDRSELYKRYRRNFMREITGGNDGWPSPKKYLSLWRLAWRRVSAIAVEAESIPSSILW